MTRKGRWALFAAIALSAFWPRVLPLPDDIPDTSIARQYAKEARSTIGWARDHPVQQAMDALFVQQWRLTDWRRVPGSAEGSPAVREAADVKVTAWGLGPWGIPIHRLTVCCGGSGFSVT